MQILYGVNCTQICNCKIRVSAGSIYIRINYQEIYYENFPRRRLPTGLNIKWPEDRILRSRI